MINGENANTATTVLSYVEDHRRDRVGAVPAWRDASAGPSGAVVQLEPRVWYNPDLRSTLFLVPGLLAYIGMITAVVSTALSVVREKERGTMEQVRMAPIGTLPFVVGKSLPYFVVVDARGDRHRVRLDGALRPAGARLVVAAAALDGALSVRRAGDGAAHLHHRPDASRSPSRWRCSRRSCRRCCCRGSSFRSRACRPSSRSSRTSCRRGTSWSRSAACC